MDWIDCFPIFVLVLCHCSTSFLHGHLSHVNNSPFTVGRVYLLFGLGSHALKRCVTPARAVAKETREQTAMRRIPVLMLQYVQHLGYPYLIQQ